MYAKIYRPRPSAMSSGRAKTHHWILEFESDEPRAIDPLTGNAISTDTREQVRMTFDTLEDAVSYAKTNEIPHRVHGSNSPKRIPRSYSENFAFDRKLPWTH
ncbi:MAG: ETC complex I subunit [Litorimonas sp.]